MPQNYVLRKSFTKYAVCVVSGVEYFVCGIVSRLIERIRAS